MSARAEAPEGWARFLAGQADPTTIKNRLEVSLSRAGFLSFFGDPRVRVVGIAVSATFAESASPPASPTGVLPFSLTLPPESGNTVQAISGLSLPFRRGEPRTTLVDGDGALDFHAFEVGTMPATILFDVVESGASQIASAIRTSEGLLKPDALEDLWLSFTYEEVVS